MNIQICSVLLLKSNVRWYPKLNWRVIGGYELHSVNIGYYRVVWTANNKVNRANSGEKKISDGIRLSLIMSKIFELHLVLEPSFQQTVISHWNSKSKSSNHAWFTKKLYSILILVCGSAMLICIFFCTMSGHVFEGFVSAFVLSLKLMPFCVYVCMHPYDMG